MKVTEQDERVRVRVNTLPLIASLLASPMELQLLK